MTKRRIATDRAGLLQGNGVCPSVDDVLSPLSLLGVGWTPRVDRRECDAKLCENVAVIIRHRVISRDEHPPGRGTEQLDERTKQRLVLQSVQVALREGRSGATTSLQLRRDSIVDIRVNHEQSRLGQ